MQKKGANFLNDFDLRKMSDSYFIDHPSIWMYLVFFFTIKFRLCIFSKDTAEVMCWYGSQIAILFSELQSIIITRADAMICGAQCKMKMHGYG